MKAGKKIQKEIKRLREELNKVELRPCSGDLELKQKEKEILKLKRDIYELEREANQFELFNGKGGKVNDG
jgi:hypothetical protein